jgi:hypothetical protein
MSKNYPVNGSKGLIWMAGQPHEFIYAVYEDGEWWLTKHEGREINTGGTISDPVMGFVNVRWKSNENVGITIYRDIEANDAWDNPNKVQ